MCPVSSWLHRNGGPAVGVWGQCRCLFWKRPDASGLRRSSRLSEHCCATVQETGQGNGCLALLFLFSSLYLSSCHSLPYLLCYLLNLGGAHQTLLGSRSKGAWALHTSSVCMPVPRCTGHSPQTFEGHLGTSLSAATKSPYLTTKKFSTELKWERRRWRSRETAVGSLN